MRSFLVLAGALLASVATAQTVHVVGSGGFAQIQPAINAAANGDVIVIQSGAYLPFTLAKDLTLTAAPGAAVDVAPPSPAAPGVTVLQPPALAKIVGLRFRVLSFQLFPSQVRVDGGTVHFADCVFESSRFTPTAALLVQNASVALQRCVAIGGGTLAIGTGSSAGCDGVSAVNATVAAVDCLFLGGNLNWDFTGRAGHALIAASSNVHLANCIVVGGDNAAWNPGWPPGDGVHVATTSRVWLADCQLRGGDGHTSPGGHGLTNLGATAAQEARSSFLGGPGAPTGTPVLGPLVTTPLLGVDGVTPAITIGAPWNVGYRTAPGTPVLALFADTLSPSVLPVLAEPAWLPLASFGVVGAAITGANGVTTFAFAIPNAPSLLHALFFVQAIAGTALPLEVAPPVGGVVR